MRKRVIAALAVGLMAAGGEATAQVIVTMVPTGPYKAPGEPALMAREVTEAPVTNLQGEITKKMIIGQHTLAAAEVAVLDAPVQGKQRPLPAGALLWRVDYKGGSAWCDLQGPSKLFSLAIDCLEDVDGNRFTRLSTGYSAEKFQGGGSSGVERGERLPAPAPFHLLPREERLKTPARLAYQYCDGDGVATPPRFALVASTLNDPNAWLFAGACRFGVWPDPKDKSRVEVDGMLMTVTPNGAGGLRYKLDDRLPPGPLATLTRLGSARPGAEQAEAEGGEMLVLTGAPPAITEGTVKVGATFFRAAVAHGLTGHLRNQIRPGMMWRGDTAVEVGQPVFGIPSGDDGEIVWCAPRVPPGGAAYDTACFIPTGWNPWWIPHRKPALLPWESLYSLGQTGSSSSVPSVERGPINLPPMTLSLVVAEMKPARAAGKPMVVGIDWVVDWGEGPQVFRRINYETSAEGRRIQLLGQRMQIKPNADLSGITVQR
jgi:hypothetical protein